jgi:VWFA-related protein
MRSFLSKFGAVVTVVGILLSASGGSTVFGQSRPQRPVANPNEKRNQRPDPEELRRQEEAAKAEFDPIPLAIATKLVNVDVVVYERKTGRIVTGLTEKNFAIFENGVRQDITNFADPEQPITVTMVVEFSKWTEVFGRQPGFTFEPGTMEVVRPAALFLTQFIRPPDDFASLIAFDIRPTPITDFTNDPARLRQTANLLLRSLPAFRENNLFDTINFALVGGKADSVVLDRSDKETYEYAGMTSVRSKRKAIILIASGINTFSRINYDQVRRTIQESGIPFYVISTGNLFFKRYEQFLPPTDYLDGTPGAMTFRQAENTMNTIAKESGGQHFPLTFPSEVPGILQSINALLRNQYSLGFDPGDKPKDGKRYKLEVRVDVNGDGIFDDKQYIVQHRPFYVTENERRRR